VSERDAAKCSDVVILTTTGRELDALLEVDTGAVPCTAWEVGSGPGGLRLARREFLGYPHALRVAAAALGDMTEEAAAVHTLVLVSALEAQCVAVCGACSARGDQVWFGDVAVADRLLHHEPDRRVPERTQHDLAAYRLRDDWRAWLEGVDVLAAFRDADWLARRPLTTQWRERRALAAFHAGVVDPSRAVDPRLEPWRSVDPVLDAREWRAIMRKLRSRQSLELTRRSLSERGDHALAALLLEQDMASELAELLREYGGELPDLSPTGALQPFRLHIGPLQLGRRPIDDGADAPAALHAIGELAAQQTLAAVLAALAHRQRQHQLDLVVLHSVAELADHDRDRQFEPFIARAVAECALWFVRQRVVPRQADPA